MTARNAATPADLALRLAAGVTSSATQGACPRSVPVGWWLGGIYLAVAWFLCVILITLPIRLYLMNRVRGVMSLLRY
jgi:hypothetical protein